MMLDYGTAGLVGLLVPQANTIAEAEIGVLAEPDIAVAVSRLTCFESDSRTRLLGYFHNAAAALRAFDTARPQVALFACTGSTYLIGLAEEDRAFAALPVPVVSAARAVLAALDALQARRIALVSPYPTWLNDACALFWRSQGREIVEVRGPGGDRSDTRRIYRLGTSDALDALRGVKARDIDCIVVTGTGMPTLSAIASAANAAPVLSSNLCLAWAARQRLAGAELDRASLQAWLATTAPWRARLAMRFPHSMESIE